jgi:hypothetical protein
MKANPMSAPYLSHVTLETLENCRTAATQGVLAYRAGSHRLVGLVNGALARSVMPRTTQLAQQANALMSAMGGSVTQIVIKGLDQTAARAATAIELGTYAAGTQLNKLARFADKVDNAAVASGLQTVARWTMPGAKAALAISGTVAAGAVALANAAGAHPVRRAAKRAAPASKAPQAQARRVGPAISSKVKRTTRL